MNPQMKPIAAGLASFGRGDDKMLVHMTPGEVAGLQAIAMKHGGSLTINPHTGLPEAGFLSSILPTIAGAGLMAMGVPSPWLAAGLVGGASALTSGSLKKGLMAGLGAFGGAGLGSALGGMGEEAAKQAANLVAQNAGAGAVGAIGPEGIAEALRVSPLDIDYGMGVVPGTNIGTEKLADYTNAYQRAYGNRMAEYAALNPFEKMGKGLEYAIQNPEAALTKKNAVFAGSALAPMGLASLEDAQRRQAERMRMLGQQAVSQQAPGFEQYRFSPGSYNPLTGQFEGRGSQYLGRASTFAQGGSIPDLNQQYPQSDINRAAYATSSQTPMGSEVLSTYAPKTDPFTGQVRMASGGIAGLQEYKAGGQLLDGPGDGMSDDIPAVIKGERPQRAALADGEFVVPADVVSHLGNGSTKAGAKRLYAMMDKVRMARVGTKKQGRQINPEKFIPA